MRSAHLPRAKDYWWWCHFFYSTRVVILGNVYKASCSMYAHKKIHPIIEHPQIRLSDGIYGILRGGIGSVALLSHNTLK